MTTREDCTVSIYTKQASQKISRHIYGHFAEHLGWSVYGGLFVGDDSTIPNIQGIRIDVLNALKKLKVPNIRWPGGCFADTYHWKDGIGPKNERPAIVNSWWGGVTEDNSFGTHDFLNLCELLGAEPFISANVGSGSVQQLMEWVQYVNFQGQSPMSDLRKKNGKENPWSVKYWGLGNEAWGCGGNMRAEFYSDIFRQYSTFMTDWSNTSSVFRIASGAQSSDYHWTKVLMENIPLNLIEGLGLHHYTVINWNEKGPSTGFSEDQYFKSMKVALFMEELIKNHSAIMDRYDPQKKVALVVDEWGGWYDPEPGTNPGFLYQQNTMRDAMIAGVTLNIFNNHSDRVRMANLAQMVNVLQALILVKDEKFLLTPTYHVMDMYSAHQDSHWVPSQIETPFYNYNNEHLPAISVSASLNDQSGVHITLANIHATESIKVLINLDCSFDQCRGEILSSGAISDHNSFGESKKVQPKAFNEFVFDRSTVTGSIPPFSVVLLKLY